MKKALILIVTLALLAAVAPAFGAGDSQADQPVPQRFRGRIAAMSGPASGATAFLVFHVDRYATDAFEHFEVAVASGRVAAPPVELMLSPEPSVKNRSSSRLLRLAKGSTAMEFPA